MADFPLPDIVPHHLLVAPAPASRNGYAPRPVADSLPDSAEIEAMLACMPPHFGPDSYETWLKVLMGVHAVMGDAGIGLCERYVPGKPGEIAAKFGSFDAGGGTGVGTLIDIAKRYGYQPPRSVFSEGEGLAELDADAIVAVMAGEVAGESLPEIQVNNRQLSDVLNDLQGALRRRNERDRRNPALMKRGGILVRVPAAQGDMIQPVSAGAFGGIAAAVARWVNVRPGKGDDPLTITNVFPPRDVVNTYVAADDWPEVPRLEGLLKAPTYIGQGRWVKDAGYDLDSGLYLTRSVQTDSPDAGDLAWAKALIEDELLVDFPFKDEASKTHAIAFFLLPFVRHVIDGPTPMTLVDAPTPGTGKGLLVSACAMAALGDEVSSVPMGRDEEDIRKRITAMLQAGTSIASFDNVTGKLDSPSLAMALTQGIWEDRQLGVTHMLRLPIRTIWAVTANNIQPSDEIARRCVWIRLDASMEKPNERTGFKHPKLLHWAKNRRADLVAAAMTLVQHWVTRGEPPGNYVKGSYQAWANVIGGILDCADIGGFLSNEHELFDTAVSEINLWRSFVEEWAATHHELPVTTKELFHIASHYDSDSEGMGLLDDLLGAGNERSRQTRFGIKLGQMADRVVENWKILRGTVVKGHQTWRLAQASGASQPAAAHDAPPEVSIDDLNL